MNVRQVNIAFGNLLGEFDSNRVAQAQLLERGVKVREADLSNWSNPHHSTSAPTHVTHTLERICCKPIVARPCMAEVKGVSEDQISLAVLSSQAVQYAAKAGAKVIAADADGIVTPGEEVDCAPDLDRAISAFQELRRTMSLKAQKAQGAAE